MGKKYTFEDKVDAYLKHLDGKTWTEMSFEKMRSKMTLAGEWTRMRKLERRIRPAFESKSTEEKACIRNLVSNISSNSLSLAEKSALVQGIGIKKYQSWYLAWKRGMLDETPNTQEVMAKPEKKKKLSSKDIQDEKDRRIYWLELENAYLKKKLEIRERLRQEAQNGRKK